MQSQLREIRPPADRGDAAAVARASSAPGGDRYDRTLEDRLKAMRALLARVRPGSDAEALHALRAAFPGSSLSERVAVLGRDTVQGF